MKIHFKKILVAFIVIAGFVFYGLYQHFNNIRTFYTAVFCTDNCSSKKEFESFVSDQYLAYGHALGRYLLGSDAESS